NLTTAFAIQCQWYRELAHDDTYAQLEQANFDWLFGCNPWGTSMVYGLPAWGDTPTDPHSAFTHQENFPIDGGLVDGPVFGSIFNNLIGIRLTKPDAHAPFQSDLAVYHDDYGDYSTNEPTMDGTASLIYLLAAKEYEQVKGFPQSGIKTSLFTQDKHGAIIRGNKNEKKLSLIFSADEFGEGTDFILKTLKESNQKGSFFFTGNYLKNGGNTHSIDKLVEDGHYLGAHSAKHLLYSPWENRDSLLINKEEFEEDIEENYKLLQPWRITKKESSYFLPPYEWYNSTVNDWANGNGLKIINFTPGIRTPADYTWPEMGSKYLDNERIFKSVEDFMNKDQYGLNGAIILIHAGTDPKRIEKFYNKLPEMIELLTNKGYTSVTIDKLLNE